MMMQLFNLLYLYYNLLECQLSKFVASWAARGFSAENFARTKYCRKTLISDIDNLNHIQLCYIKSTKYFFQSLHLDNVSLHKQ